MDITGNWRESSGYLPHIQTREPTLNEGQAKRFEQQLDLPSGDYAIEIEYNDFFDSKSGAAIKGQWKAFGGLRVNGRVLPLAFQPVLHSSCHRAIAPFRQPEGAPQLELSLDLANTRPLRTWIHGLSGRTRQARYFNPVAMGGGELLMAHGLPFRVPEINFRFVPAWPITADTVETQLAPAWPPPVESPIERGVYRGGLLHRAAGIHIACDGAAPEAIHFLGMVHNMDIANGSWYSPRGDHGFSHFVGDRLGEIILRWEGGESSVIPLVLGFNMWFGQPWDIFWHYKPAPGIAGENFDADLFGGDLQPRSDIEQAAALVDGVRLMGCASTNARYIFSVNTGGRRLLSMELRGCEEFHDYPLISAVTLECLRPPAQMEPLPDLLRDDPRQKLTELSAILNEDFLPAVRRVMKHFYTFTAELPKLSNPTIDKGYLGPRYDFRGSPDALYAATYLYRNGPECGSFIADNGMGCASPVSNNHALAQYVFGTGMWRRCASHYGSLPAWFEAYQRNEPGQLPGRGGAWSRGIGELLREAVAFGYDKFAASYLDWIDAALFQFANPPHWNRVVGGSYARQERMVDDLVEAGNRENDGHGIIMWGRYMAYHWAGHSPEWSRRRWKATEASVEWLQWQVDTDTLFPGRRADILYTESECAHGGYDIYSSFNCLHGLRLAIRMAYELGEKAAADRWNLLHRRLRKGILDELVEPSAFGPIWKTDPHCDWQDHAHKMVPIHLATEGDTYTPLEDYAARDEIDRQYLDISRNSYRYLLRDRQYDCLRMYGYGQGMMTQAALLLDEMADAERFLALLIRRCYLPKFAGWASPEGIIMHRSGEYYVPVNIYTGQDSHLADSTKAVRLLLGADDNDPAHLRLVPRFPTAWTSMSVQQFPVLIGRQRQLIDYVYCRTERGEHFDLQSPAPIARLSLRLGPLPEGRSVAAATCNGVSVPFQLCRSGDSRWVWIRDLPGNQFNVTLQFQQ